MRSKLRSRSSRAGLRLDLTAAGCWALRRLSLFWRVAFVRHGDDLRNARRQQSSHGKRDRQLKLSNRVATLTRFSLSWHLCQLDATKMRIMPTWMRTYITVGSQASWRMVLSQPAALQNFHEDGGGVFLIFVADPRTVRSYRNLRGHAAQLMTRLPVDC